MGSLSRPGVSTVGAPDLREWAEGRRLLPTDTIGDLRPLVLSVPTHRSPPHGASLSQPQRLPPPRSSRRRHHGHDADSHSPNPVKCAGRLGRRKGAARPSGMGLRPTLPPPYGGRRRLVVGNGTSPGVIDSDDRRFGVDTARPSRARDEVDGGGAMSSADQVRRRDRMPEVRYGARLAPAADARPHERADWLTG